MRATINNHYFSSSRKKTHTFTTIAFHSRAIKKDALLFRYLDASYSNTGDSSEDWIHNHMLPSGHDCDRVSCVHDTQHYFRTTPHCCVQGEGIDHTGTPQLQF